MNDDDVATNSVIRERVAEAPSSSSARAPAADQAGADDGAGAPVNPTGKPTEKPPPKPKATKSIAQQARSATYRATMKFACWL